MAHTNRSISQPTLFAVEEVKKTVQFFAWMSAYVPILSKATIHMSKDSNIKSMFNFCLKFDPEDPRDRRRAGSPRSHYFRIQTQKGVAKHRRVSSGSDTLSSTLGSNYSDKEKKPNKSNLRQQLLNSPSQDTCPGLYIITP